MERRPVLQLALDFVDLHRAVKVADEALCLSLCNEGESNAL
jgi:3-keto-L-gulonate-6-phosphate decarboxylase